MKTKGPDDYNANKSKLSQLIREQPSTQPPIQEVRPVRAETSSKPIAVKSEAHLNFWVSDELMTRIKMHSVTSKKSVRQIGIEALEAYLDLQKT